MDQFGHASTRSQDVSFPNHCQGLDSWTISATFVLTLAFLECSWIQRGADLQIRQSYVAAVSPPRIFGVSAFASTPSLDQCWTTFSGCADVSSTALAPASTRGGSKCDGNQETANFLPSLSGSKLCFKAVIQQKMPVSEIAKPSPAAAELFNVSAPLAAAATRVRVGPSGDVEMTPVDQTQQSEDANLRKIVAQFDVNLGHPRTVWRI